MALDSYHNDGLINRVLDTELRCVPDGGYRVWPVWVILNKLDLV